MPLSSAPSINLLAQQFPISFLPPALSTAAQSNKTYCPTLLHLSLCIIFHVSSFPGTQRKHFSIPCPSNNKSVSGLQDMWDICSPRPPSLAKSAEQLEAATAGKIGEDAALPTLPLATVCLVSPGKGCRSVWSVPWPGGTNTSQPKMSLVHANGHFLLNIHSVLLVSDGNSYKGDNCTLYLLD